MLFHLVCKLLTRSPVILPQDMAREALTDTGNRATHAMVELYLAAAVRTYLLPGSTNTLGRANREPACAHRYS